MTAAIWWLLAGGIMVALEAFILPGIGLLFAGLAAIVVGAAVQMELVANPYAQAGLFLALTGAWAALLWKPLKKFHRGSHKGAGYQNIVGTTAAVINEPLVKGKKGQVRWSGTNMQAVLDPHALTDNVAVGQEVTVVAIEGIVLTVRPH